MYSICKQFHLHQAGFLHYVTLLFPSQAGRASKERLVGAHSAHQGLLATKETKEEQDCQVCTSVP